MKNTLAENMLRFAPKNLKASNIKTLKRLVEQEVVAQQLFAPLAEQASYDPTTPNQILVSRIANTKWLFVPMNGGKIVTMPVRSAIASAPVQTGGRLIACTTPFKVTDSPEIEGSAIADWTRIFYTMLPYDSLDITTATTTDVADQQRKKAQPDSLQYDVKLFAPMKTTVNDLLRTIGDLLRRNTVNTNDASTRKAVADFIIGIQKNRITTITDFQQNGASLTDNTFVL